MANVKTPNSPHIPSILMDPPLMKSGLSPKFSEWVENTFLGIRPTSAKIGLQDVKQGWGELRRGKTIELNPIRIGARHFAKGLGIHAVSEVNVFLPTPARRLTAHIGIDDETKGLGSVIFTVETEGRELFRSGVCRGHDAPVPISVELNGAKKVTLRVLDAGDGVIHMAHADWADAKILLADGHEILLDELSLVDGEFFDELPFSFTLDGKSSRTFLHEWRRTVKSESEKDGRTLHVLSFSDPTTGLELRCELTCFSRHPAAEWVLRLKNTGKAESPCIEDLKPLDCSLKTCGKEIILHHSNGSTNSDTDFLPVDEKLDKRNPQIDIAPTGGRSSDGALPFFNLEWEGQGGIVAAIGWSGQWSLQLRLDGKVVKLGAGQQTTRFRLHPGEEIRTPRIAILHWEGPDCIKGNNLFRRLVIDQYTPRIDGKLAIPPVTANTWFTFDSGNKVTEANQTALMPSLAKVGVEGYWLDAGWFEGGWPSGAGSWVAKKEAFTDGLKPVGDEAHRLGMKFILWFEPERITTNSRIFKEHPEWVMHPNPENPFGCLLKLGDPDACKWITEYLSKCISDWGVDVLRIDFNFPPLPFWEANDTPDRRGISEIRYVENLYKMWDDLRERHPGLTIDNCAGGGRRIDLETISRSYPLWQSDTQCCFDGHDVNSIWNQVQNAGLSLYVPLHSGGMWDFDPYSFRSMATMGTVLCRDINDAALEKTSRKMIDEMKSLRPCYLGDYYPLLNISLEEAAWCGWQYDRPDLGEGFAMLFRREKSVSFMTGRFPLRGLDSAAEYEIIRVDSGERAVITGASLLDGLEVTIAERPGSALIRYRKRTSAEDTVFDFSRK